jgi:hypothetical protein
MQALDVANGALVRPILTRARTLRSGLGRADTKAVADFDARLREITAVVDVKPSSVT